MRRLSDVCDADGRVGLSNVLTVLTPPPPDVVVPDDIEPRRDGRAAIVPLRIGIKPERSHRERPIYVASGRVHATPRAGRLWFWRFSGSGAESRSVTVPRTWPAPGAIRIGLAARCLHGARHRRQWIWTISHLQAGSHGFDGQHELLGTAQHAEHIEDAPGHRLRGVLPGLHDNHPGGTGRDDSDAPLLLLQRGSRGDRREAPQAAAAPTEEVLGPPSQISSRTSLVPCRPSKTARSTGARRCRRIQSTAGGTRCFLRDDAFGYRYRHTTYGDREVNYSLTYDMTSQGPFADDVINNVRVQAVYITEDTLRLRIHDEDRHRYEVPVLDDSPLMRNPPAVDKSRLRYLIEANETRRGRARLRVLRSDNYVVMLDSWHLVMTEQFLQVVLPYSGDQLYGFGESGHEHINLAMGSGTMFSRRVSNYSAMENANANWDNFAGVHPFFMNPKGDGTTWGVLILNSNAMDYTVTSGGNIAIATTGGILDLYFFVGSTPTQVVQQYQKDMIWLDVFQDSKAFTLNSAFGGLQTYARQLASAGIQVGLVTNPAIPADNVTRYAPYTTGLEDDVFVKKGSGTSGSDPNAVLYAKGLPSGPSAFPDFLKNSTRQWWRNIHPGLPGIHG
ncbi:hypothetical protein MTO96_007496 [Rhipicephalus appendiculatus]